jgi:hypothetical protein
VPIEFDNTAAPTLNTDLGRGDVRWRRALGCGVIIGCHFEQSG